MAAGISYPTLHFVTGRPAGRQGMTTREQNERTFGQWESLPGGGRRYRLEVVGHHGWTARYVKDVDPDENTLRFWQEIRDERGRLVEVRVKYPTDEGHRRTRG